MDVLTFAETSLKIFTGLKYVHNELISGIVVTTPTGKYYHIIDWMSQKKRRISNSSYGAEILSFADGDDRGLSGKTCVNELASGSKGDHILHCDFRELFATIATLDNGREYRLRQIVQGNRDSFEVDGADIIW